MARFNKGRSAYKKYASQKKADSRKKYRIRKSQLFGPWGVGAILPCPDGSSVMIAGLDRFPQSGLDAINDPRLARHIGVSNLFSPPVEGQGVIPAVRFPLWMYCPDCGRMRRVKPTSTTMPHCENTECRSKRKPSLVPERFIVVCPEGHIDDVPLLEWVHRGSVDDPEKHILTRWTRGGSATLGDIEYRCSCGKHRSLLGITRPGALEEIGYHCHGNRPWLGPDAKEQCQTPAKELRVVQRGGTNVWYADVASSIRIPDSLDDRLISLVSSNISDLRKFEEMGEEALAMSARFLGSQNGMNYPANQVIAAYHKLAAAQNEAPTSEGSYREEEFEALCRPDQVHANVDVFEGARHGIDEYSSPIMASVVEAVTLVTTLKETRALVGFTRLYPDHNEGLSFWRRRRALSNDNLNWTIATQMTGEGIFIKLNQSAIEEWQSHPSAVKRIAQMQHQLDQWNGQRAKSGEEQRHDVINPAYVLIHTLAHILMLSITKECGYPTASVRERIYCDRYVNDDDRHKDMLGLLIYTASEDSAGSLGGLVRAGAPGRLETIFDRAVIDAQWCSSDPVCIESPGQGPGSCNLAACYSCALVPETSCELGNRMLDRGVLVGTLSDESSGIFSSVLRLMTEDGVGRIPSIRYRFRREGKADLSDTSFGDACRAILHCASNGERDYVNELVELSTNADLEIPRTDCVLSAENKEAAPSLVWEKAHVALLLQEDVEDFLDAFGEHFRSSSNWTLVPVCGDFSPRQLISLLRERADG